jgi:histidine ammonia-lyase
MRSLPPLEFTLDGPGLTLEQLRAVFRHQQEMQARRRAREAADQMQQAIENAARGNRLVRAEHEIL